MPTPTKAGYRFTNWKHADCVNLVNVADKNISYSASNGESVFAFNIPTVWSGGKTFTYSISFDYKFNQIPSNQVCIKTVLSPTQYCNVTKALTPALVDYPNLSMGHVAFSFTFGISPTLLYTSDNWLYFYLVYSPTAQDVNVDISHIQLENGETATTFIPYYISSTSPKLTVGNDTLTALYVENSSYLSSNWADRIGRKNLYNYTKELLFTKDVSQISGYSNSISVGTNSVTDTSAYVQSDAIDDVIAYYNDYSKIVFYSPCTIYAPENSSYLFAPYYEEKKWFLTYTYLPSFTSIVFDNFNTKYVTNMSYMFKGDSRSVGTIYSKLTNLDLSMFNTSKVTTMHGMFKACSSLASIDLSSFQTSSVTNMAYLFSKCSSLTSIDLSGFTSSKVTDMTSMFENCSSLTSLDLGDFSLAGIGTTTSTSTDENGNETSTTTFNTGSMLSSCSALASITLPYNLPSGCTITLPASTYYNGSAGPYGTVGTATSGTTVACSTADTKVTLTKQS
ncbi:MAG: BspA family leucine-rich repeat surface protein [Christensenellales bacterium]